MADFNAKEYVAGLVEKARAAQAVAERLDFFFIYITKK